MGLLIIVATAVGCSTSSAANEASKPAETPPKATGEQDGQRTAHNQVADKSSSQPKADQAAPISGPLACASDPAELSELAAEPPGPDSAPPLRVELPDELAAIEPPENAGKPISDTTCKGAAYSSASQSLAFGGRAFRRCCRADSESDFMIGCRRPAACTLDIPTAGGSKEVQTAAQLAQAVAPVDSVAEAIGMVAIYDRRVWAPYGPDVAAEIGQAAKYFEWAPVEEAPVAITADEHPWGWVVRVPAYPKCGCHHHLYRMAFRVTRSGEVCRLPEMPALIGYAQKSVCID